jgi:hypothetical protein
MIDDQHLKDSFIFSLFTKKELEQEKFIDEINIIVEKYNILENENQLINSRDNIFLHLINYILNLHNKKKDIPEDLKNLFLENTFLKEQSNFFLEKTLDNLTKNDSTHFFNKISLILSILSVGIKEDILNSYSTYNYDSISKLFRFYESLLKNLFQKDSELFSLTFDSYIILLKVFIQLCNINSIDIIQARTINKIIELMTESLNIIKYTVPLDEKKLNKINNMQGKYLYYFSHIDEITIDINSLDKSIEKYFFCLEKQKDGYIISGENNSDSQEFLIFKNYSSILILKLIKKLKNLIDEKIYFHSENFQKILRFYYKNFSMRFDHNIIENIKNFEEELLHSLLYNYNISRNVSKIITCYSIIEDFIFSGKDFDNRNLETIYRILFFASDIEDFKYYYIAQLLAETSPLNNDYHEFYKLSIFDLIIDKSLIEKDTIQKEEILNKIFDYINNNDINYQLLSIYSKLFLSLSFFYSMAEKNFEKAKEVYAIFIQISHNEIFENEYLNINNKIIENFKSHNPKITQKNIEEKFRIKKNLELKKEIININSKINRGNRPSIDDMKNILSKLISNKIFHGLCEVQILDLQNKHENIINNQFEEYTICLNKNYIIQFLFSLEYKIKFMHILDDYKEFIEKNICIILNKYEEKINYYYSDDDEYEITY